jgi:hypothetical protein
MCTTYIRDTPSSDSHSTQGIPDRSKSLTKSNTAQDNYVRDPQTGSDVLKFHTDHQKREMEDLRAAPRFDCGTGTAVALEKQEEQPNEQKISTITEAQIIQLQQVVSRDDPNTLYSMIKKVGERYVSLCRVDGC